MSSPVTPQKRRRPEPYIDLANPLPTPPRLALSPSPPAAPRTPYHQAFNEDTGDIILSSTDDVLFRIESFILKASSRLFRDMLHSTHIGGRSSGNSASQAIPIDSHSDDLALFLEFMRSPSVPSDIPIPQCQTLLSLCEKYSCPLVRERILFRLSSSPSIERYPWSIFGLASQYEDLELGRNAIKSMGYDPIARKLKLKLVTKSLVDEVRPTWLFALLQAIEAVGLLRELTFSEWQRVARIFRPLE